MKPASQSYGSEVDPNPDSNQSSRGSSRSKLNKQQLVMMQVKSLLGRTVSKSPPAPTYLYVVSCMYCAWPVPTYEIPPEPGPPPPQPTPQAVHSSPAATPHAPPLLPQQAAPPRTPPWPPAAPLPYAPPT